MVTKFTSLTEAGPDWPQLCPIAFDLTGENKPPFVYQSQKYNSTGSSSLASEAVVRALSNTRQPVAGIHDPHSLEFC